ncbi:oxidoreductase [Pedobacter yulinensis]|uniref:Oxidoreductase n=1 Tax=Pedobacter yulinensis TaxID=2126353 RepID=A0A2T3HNN6_9SPHI|nr:Gfo/Idh/MocA family oxidoreductase [Pedobacter yulinensis]PST84013.1 oxidoreductase [Pedobacter yulinensis]
MSKRISTGILAYGMSGKVFHAPFVAAHEGFEFRAVVERNQKQAAADYDGIISYNAVEELIADPLIELVVVNTPNYLHYEHTRMALLAGKHVLAEKPFAATAAQASELFELARKQDRKIFVYQNRRCDSDFLAIKQVLDENRIGQPIEAHFRFDRYRAAIGPKIFKEQPYEASGLQYDLGPHLLDQAISLFGTPESYTKILSGNRPGTQVDDYFHIQLRYPDNLCVFLTASLLVAEPQAGFVLHGTKGSFIKNRTDVQETQLLKHVKPTDPGYGIEGSGQDGLLVCIAEDGERQVETIKPQSGNYLRLFDSVYSAITQGTTYPVSEEEILLQLEILEAE